MCSFGPYQPEPPGRRLAPRLTVILPELMFLFITGEQGFCNELFPRIIVPRNPSHGSYVLELKSFFPVNPEGDSFDGLMRGFTTFFKDKEEDAEDDFPCRAWKLCILEGPQLTIDAYDTEDNNCDPMGTVPLQLSPMQSDSIIAAIFEIMQNTRVLKEADTLKFKIDIPLDFNSRIGLISLLKSCHKVVKVVLMGATTVDIMLNQVFMDDSAQAQPQGTDSQAAIVLPDLDLFVYNEDENEVRLIDNLLFRSMHWRKNVGRKIPELTFCLQDPDWGDLYLREAHPDINALELELDVTESEEWDVVTRTPFPHIF